MPRKDNPNNVDIAQNNSVVDLSAARAERTKLETEIKELISTGNQDNITKALDSLPETIPG